MGEASKDEAEDEDLGELEDRDSDAGDDSTAALAGGPVGLTGKTIAVSPQLELLIRKISAFERLLRRKNFARAAIIAQDVLQSFEHFDPRIYLPSVFSPFFSMLAQYGDKVEPVMKEPEGLTGRALKHLFEVDLDSFARGKNK